MKLIKKTAYLLGNVLIKIYPDKADKLSKDRITLIHKDKKNLSITERLIRYALVRKLEKLTDHNEIARNNYKFWTTKNATQLFTETASSYETLFLPHCTFIFDILERELDKQNRNFNYDYIVEIGTGNGKVLNYLSLRYPEVKKLIGIDLSYDQIELNKTHFRDNKKLYFIAADAMKWINEYGNSNTLFISCNGVLEYFLEDQLLIFLKDIKKLNNIDFIAIEPNGEDHDFSINPKTQLYGNEPSFSHNYPKLFKDAEFELWHFSQKPWLGSNGIQTFIGARG